MVRCFGKSAPYREPALLVKSQSRSPNKVLQDQMYSLSPLMCCNDLLIKVGMVLADPVPSLVLKGMFWRWVSRTLAEGQLTNVLLKSVHWRRGELQKSLPWVAAVAPATNSEEIATWEHHGFCVLTLLERRTNVGDRVTQLAEVIGVHWSGGKIVKTIWARENRKFFNLSSDMSLKSVLCDAVTNFSSCENLMTQFSGFRFMKTGPDFSRLPVKILVSLPLASLRFFWTFCSCFGGGESCRCSAALSGKVLLGYGFIFPISLIWR